MVKYDPAALDYEGEQHLFKGVYASDVEESLSAHNLAQSLATLPEQHVVQSSPHAMTATLISDNPKLDIKRLAMMPMPENPQTAAVALLKQAMLVSALRSKKNPTSQDMWIMLG